MAEIDVAVGVIFGFGLLGIVIEPWSPHPPLMVLFACSYICTRIATAIMVSYFSTNKEV